MKIFNSFSTLLLFISLTGGIISAQETDKKISNEQIIENLIKGIKSDNQGLRVSAAYYLGENRSSEAVELLMQMLREGNDYSERLIAALSLYKIGDERGIFLIKRIAELEEDSQITKMCKILSNMWDQFEAVK